MISIFLLLGFSATAPSSAGLADMVWPRESDDRCSDYWPTVARQSLDQMEKDLPLRVTTRSESSKKVYAVAAGGCAAANSVGGLFCHQGGLVPRPTPSPAVFACRVA